MRNVALFIFRGKVCDISATYVLQREFSCADSRPIGHVTDRYKTGSFPVCALFCPICRSLWYILWFCYVS